MHNRFVIRRYPGGTIEIADVHGRLVAVMADDHPDRAEIAALFVQAPVADALARSAEELILDGGATATGDQRSVWLEDLDHYRQTFGEEVPNT